MSKSTVLIQKLRNYCNFFRDYGLAYSDSIGQL